MAFLRLYGHSQPFSVIFDILVVVVSLGLSHVGCLADLPVPFLA